MLSVLLGEGCTDPRALCCRCSSSNAGCCCWGSCCAVRMSRCSLIGLRMAFLCGGFSFCDVCCLVLPLLLRALLYTRQIGDRHRRRPSVCKLSRATVQRLLATETLGCLLSFDCLFPLNVPSPSLGRLLPPYVIDLFLLALHASGGRTARLSPAVSSPQHVCVSPAVSSCSISLKGCWGLCCSL